MSTRGCVAIVEGDGWRGVYNHSDSYPTGLGAELWEYLKGRELDKFSSELLKTDDWSHFLLDRRCPYCGRITKTSPHTIRGDVYINGRLDPDCEGHKHSKKMAHITSQDPNPLFIEWVYALAPRDRLLSIFASTRLEEPEPGEPVTYTEPWSIRNLDGSVTEYPGAFYVHRLVGQFPLDGPEPDWEALEER